MKKILMSLIGVMALIFTFNFSSGQNYDEMGPKLTKLTSAVVSTIRYRKVPDNISDNELLLRSSKNDHGLLEPFDEYNLKIKKDNKNVIILVGTKDGEKCLLEDASWTYELDKKHWKSPVTVPFKFTIDLPK